MQHLQDARSNIRFVPDMDAQADINSMLSSMQISVSEIQMGGPETSLNINAFEQSGTELQNHIGDYMESGKWSPI